MEFRKYTSEPGDSDADDPIDPRNLAALDLSGGHPGAVILT